MSQFSLYHSKNNLWLGVFNHLEQAGIIHAVTTRLGGYSKPPYQLLNLGLHTGDDNTAVQKNRQLVCEALNMDYKALVTAEQIHGNTVHKVTAADTGKGAKFYNEAIAGTDALITDVPNIPCMLFFADCVPILIADPIKKVIAVVHAGWKGTVARIISKTISAMQTEFAVDPSNCLAGIAPSIGPCCYEVDKQVIDRLQNSHHNWQQLVTPSNSGVGDRWKLNLWLANKSQLEEAGLSPDNISISSICTSCNNSLFFSYRAEQGQTGRFGAVIALK